MKSSALWEKEDIAARQNRPHVFLIGCKHTTNPSASWSLCSPDAWMQGYGSNVKYLFIIYKDAGVRISILGSGTLVIIHVDNIEKK